MGDVAVRFSVCAVAARLLLLAVPALAVVPAYADPVQADPASQLDALSRATEKEATGLALTHVQIGEGDLLDALSTLERLILNHPENNEARLLHASVLCRIDDLPGSMVEFEDLRGHDLPKDLWSEAVQPCNALRNSTAPEHRP